MLDNHDMMFIFVIPVYYNDWTEMSYFKYISVSNLKVNIFVSVCTFRISVCNGTFKISESHVKPNKGDHCKFNQFPSTIQRTVDFIEVFCSSCCHCS